MGIKIKNYLQYKLPGDNTKNHDNEHTKKPSAFPYSISHYMIALLLTIFTIS